MTSFLDYLETTFNLNNTYGDYQDAPEDAPQGEVHPLTITVEKCEVRATERLLSHDYRLILDATDLSPEEYIEYMTDTFEDAKSYLPMGRVSVSDRGMIRVVGWGVEEALTTEINKTKD